MNSDDEDEDEDYDSQEHLRRKQVRLISIKHVGIALRTTKIDVKEREFIPFINCLQMPLLFS